MHWPHGPISLFWSSPPSASGAQKHGRALVGGPECGRVQGIGFWRFGLGVASKAISSTCGGDLIDLPGREPLGTGHPGPRREDSGRLGGQPGRAWLCMKGLQCLAQRWSRDGDSTSPTHASYCNKEPPRGRRGLFNTNGWIYIDSIRLLTSTSLLSSLSSLSQVLMGISALFSAVAGGLVIFFAPSCAGSREYREYRGK